MKFFVLLALLAGSATAQSTPAQSTPAQSPSMPMTAVEFQAYVLGKALSWSLGDQLWGSEEYLPRRQVQWATSAGEC
jgi:hypothetical protein